MKKIYTFKKIYTLLIALVALVACNSSKKVENEGLVVVANKPLELIIKELVGDRIEIHCITKPSDSPHTFSPKPSDIHKMQTGKLFFYVNKNLDSWVNEELRSDIIGLAHFLSIDSKIYFGQPCCESKNEPKPSGDCGEGFVDPHFWLNPILVKEIVPIISTKLEEAFPKHKEFINNNKDRFIKELDKLDETIKNEMAGLSGVAVLAFHQSYEYYIKQYGLMSAGAIEVAPGKEITPQYVQELKDRIEKFRIKNIFIEPQLSAKSANSLAELANVEVQVLDPLGGTKETSTYRDLLLFNTLQLKKYLAKPKNNN